MTRRLKGFFAAILLFPLASCISMSADIRFTPDEQVIVSTKLSFSQEAYAFIASSSDEDEDFCEGAEIVFGKESVSCVETETISLENALDDGAVSTGPKNARKGSFDGNLQRVGPRTLEMTLPLDFDDNGTDFGEGDEFEEAFLASLAGEVFELHISGAEILETNGLIENDGQTASLYIPMIEVMKPSDRLPENFYVLLRY